MICLISAAHPQFFYLPSAKVKSLDRPYYAANLVEYSLNCFNGIPINLPANKGYVLYMQEPDGLLEDSQLIGRGFSAVVTILVIGTSQEWAVWTPRFTGFTFGLQFDVKLTK